MTRILGTTLAVALLLGLGALAVRALPDTNAPLAEAPPISAGLPEFNPDGPAAYNVIGIPLDSRRQFASASPPLAFDSDGLGSFVGASVKQVLRWNAVRQDFDSWDPINDRGYVNGDPAPAWSLTVGAAYWLLVDSASPAVVSFVGEVPAAHSVKFTLTGPPSGCSYNEITIPLDQSDLTNADLLADSIVNKLNPADASQVVQVLHWNPGRQDFDSWDPVNNRGYVNGDPAPVWDVKIGYPYMVCVKGGLNGVVWP